jgi:hypothetical protein
MNVMTPVVAFTVNTPSAVVTLVDVQFGGVSAGFNRQSLTEVGSSVTPAAAESFAITFSVCESPIQSVV